MATKATKKSTSSKAAAAPLNAAPAANLFAFPQGFPQFEQFSKFPQFSQFPQFKQFPMEMTMMKGNKNFDKIASDAATMGQDQMDAIMKASTIWAKGMEDIIQTCVAICQEAGEKSQTAAKSVLSCKTLNEFTDVQTKLAQASFDEFMTNATKISEKSVKLCTDAMEPINDQMGKAIKKASSAAA